MYPKKISFYVAISWSIIPVTFHGMEESHQERAQLKERSQSSPVLHVSPSIRNLREFKTAEQQKLTSEQISKQIAAQKAERQQLSLNEALHEAAGLDLRDGALSPHEDANDRIRRAFAQARLLRQQGADIAWGHPLIQLLMAFKLREEMYCNYHENSSLSVPFHAPHLLYMPHVGYKPNTTVSYYVGRTAHPTIFGEGHNFFAWLIKEGAPVNDIWACEDNTRFWYSSPESSKRNYKCRADVRLKTHISNMPIHYANELCKEGCCVQALLAAGAKIPSDLLMEAFHHKNYANAQILIERGADLRERNAKGDAIVHQIVYADFIEEKERIAFLELLHKHNADLRAVNKNHETAVHIAIYDINTHAVCEDSLLLDWLLSHDPAIDTQAVDGQTALYRAVRAESSVYKTAWECASCDGKHTQSQIRIRMWERNDPKALFGANALLVKKLLTAGANPALADNRGLTPLHHAAERGMQESVALLLEHGAPVNAQTDVGLTPLHMVIVASIPLSQKTVIVEQLMKAGAVIDTGDQEGNTPLHKAVEVGKYEEAKLLLAFGAKHGALNLRNESPLEHMHSAKNALYCDMKNIENLVKEYTTGERVPHFNAQPWQLGPSIASARDNESEIDRESEDAIIL